MKKSLLIKDLNNVNGRMPELQLLVIIIRFVLTVADVLKKRNISELNTIKRLVDEYNDKWVLYSKESKYGSSLENGFLYIAKLIPLGNKQLENCLSAAFINKIDISSKFPEQEFPYDKIRGVLKSKDIDVILLLSIRSLFNKDSGSAYDELLRYLDIDPACDSDSPKAESLWGFCDEFCKKLEE